MSRDRSSIKQRWMHDVRRQIGVGGQMRLALHAYSDAERVVNDPCLGCAIVTGFRV